MWVINHNHFDTGRYAQIKKMLRYFLTIAKNEVANLVGSLCITITRKKTTDPFTKKGLLRAFDKMINSANFSADEVQLLSDLKKHILDESLPMCVAEVDDNGRSAKKIIKMVNGLKKRTADHFDFSAYCPDLKDFKEKMQKVILFKAHHTNKMTQNNIAQKNLTDRLNVLNNGISSKNTELKSATNEKNIIQQSITQLKEERVRILTRIRVINEKTTYKALTSEHDQVIKIPEQKNGTEVIEDQWPHKNNPNQWIWVHPPNGNDNKKLMDEYLKAHEGWTNHILGKTHDKFQRVESSRRVDVLCPGTSSVPIAKTLDAPCTIKAEYHPAGKYPLSNETQPTENGYHATLTYPIGEGCDVRVKFSAPEKFHPENQKELQTLQNNLDTLNQSISTQEALLNQCEKSFSDAKNELDNLNASKKEVKQDFNTAESNYLLAKAELDKHALLFDRCFSLIEKLGFCDLFTKADFFNNNQTENQSKNQSEFSQDEPDMNQTTKPNYIKRGQGTPHFHKPVKPAPHSSNPKPTQGNTKASNNLPQAKISANNMIEWDCLNFVLGQMIAQHPLCQLSTSITKLSSDGVDNQDGVVETLRAELLSLPENGRLFVPIHTDGNHFTLLALTRSGSQFKALYCDSNYQSDQEATLKMVETFCLKQLKIDHFQSMIKPLQQTIFHDGIYVVSNDCAVYVWYFCETLCNTKSFTADGLYLQVLNDNMDSLSQAKWKRLQFAEQLAEIIKNDPDKRYGSCIIDQELTSYVDSLQQQKKVFKN